MVEEEASKQADADAQLQDEDLRFERPLRVGFDE
jgi:hypothetical protein